ncbi:DNA polymerase III subunit beta [Morganella psychrotolerans]|nr:DNA polymerase III subunit beta [Morganella psychrotolerans]
MTTTLNQQAAPKKRTFKDLPGFDISANDMLSIIDAPCMIIKRGNVQFKVLEMLTLTLVGDNLSALGVDYNTGQVISRGVVHKANGDMVASVPATHISTLFRNMKGEETVNVRCDQERNRLIIRTGKNAYNIPLCMDAIPVVVESDLTAKYSITFPANMLHRTLQRVMHSAGKNDVRHYMNGVFLSLDKNVFNAVATDGHRMSVMTEDVLFTDEPQEDITSPVAPVSLSGTSSGVILPIEVCPILMKLLAANKGSFRMDYSESYLTFNLGDVTVVSNLINGRYPDWRRVAGVVKHNTEKFSVNALVLREALSRALPLINAGAVNKNSNSTGVFVFKSNALMIKSPSQNLIECKEVLDIEKVAGEQEDKIEIGMNCEYLLRSLNSLVSHSGEEADITFALKDTLTGMEIGFGDDCCDIIMPVRF